LVKRLFRLLRWLFLLVCLAFMLACVAAWLSPGTNLLYPFSAPHRPIPFGPGTKYVTFAAFRSNGHLMLHFCSAPALLSVTQEMAEVMTGEKGRIITFIHGWRFVYSVQRYSSGTHREVAIPLWMPFCAASLAVLLQSTVFFLRRRKRHPGLCPACSYDLRAHKPGQRCPECGALIVEPQTQMPRSPGQVEGRGDL
jgi:hypothetical protein